MSRFSITRLASLGLVAAAILGAVALTPRPAQAQVPPFKAYGAGLSAGSVVSAFKGNFQVGQAVVNAAGNWDMNISGGGAANLQNGDTVTFNVDGQTAAETVTFNAGQFVPPPGLKFTFPNRPTGPTGATGPTTTTATSPTAAGSLGRGQLTFTLPAHLAPPAPSFSTPPRDPAMPAPTEVVVQAPTPTPVLALFGGGGLDALLASLQKSPEVTGAWVQSPDGVFRLIIPNGPAFLLEEARQVMGNGLDGVTALTVIVQGG